MSPLVSLSLSLTPFLFTYILYTLKFSDRNFHDIFRTFRPPHATWYNTHNNTGGGRFTSHGSTTRLSLSSSYVPFHNSKYALKGSILIPDVER
jgi:hypothetical protein